jgi:purine-binding chemotaxis protein CheW
MKASDYSNLQEQEHDNDQYLTFMLGGEEYGINILKVQEIRGWDSATTIPNTPEYVLGVVNLRGIVVPIVDLRVRFELENADFNPTTVVVIVKAEDSGKERTVGMVVDAISDVYYINTDDVRDTPDMGSSVTTEYITGLTTVDEKMVILLNVDLLINSGVLQLDSKECETSMEQT